MSGVSRVSILGSTGSIGSSTLDVISRQPGIFRVVALASHSDWQIVADQARYFKPEFVALYDKESALKTRELLKGTGIEVLEGVEGILEAAATDKADVVVSAIVGAAGVMPTFAAVQTGKIVALANKEALVAAGKLITEEAKRTGATIIPVDSEHSAIFQALLGQDVSSVRKVILTASGGPFFGKARETLSGVTPEMALDHPNWKMGPKVTVDSATMMNKGLEVIEARWIFDIPAEQIEVLVHPQSIVHGMVEYMDGSVLAQMGVADMRVPISFALSYPKRLDLALDPLDLAAVGTLDFHKPDLDMFPCLGIAYKALEKGDGTPTVINAANEIAVDSFLDGELSFTGIAEVVRSVMDDPPEFDDQALSGILHGDQLARAAARRVITLMNT